MNSIAITGRLTKDPELKTTQSGLSVCAYTLAVKRPKTKDVTDFLTVVSWKQGAEYIAKFGHKGDAVAVRGVLTARSWQDKSGNNRISYEIISDTVELIGGKRDEQRSNQQETNIDEMRPYTPNPIGQSTKLNSVDLYTDEELPF